MTLSCIFTLYLITASDWSIVLPLYAGPTARADCIREQVIRNAEILRLPGSIGPTYSCRANGCSEWEWE